MATKTYKVCDRCLGEEAERFKGAHSLVVLKVYSEIYTHSSRKYELELCHICTELVQDFLKME